MRCAFQRMRRRFIALCVLLFHSRAEGGCTGATCDADEDFEDVLLIQTVSLETRQRSSSSSKRLVADLDVLDFRQDTVADLDVLDFRQDTAEVDFRQATADRLEAERGSSGSESGNDARGQVRRSSDGSEIDTGTRVAPSTVWRSSNESEVDSEAIGSPSTPGTSSNVYEDDSEARGLLSTVWRNSNESQVDSEAIGSPSTLWTSSNGSEDDSEARGLLSIVWRSSNRSQVNSEAIESPSTVARSTKGSEVDSKATESPSSVPRSSNVSEVGSDARDAPSEHLPLQLTQLGARYHQLLIRMGSHTATMAIPMVLPLALVCAIIPALIVLWALMLPLLGGRGNSAGEVTDQKPLGWNKQKELTSNSKQAPPSKTSRSGGPSKLDMPAGYPGTFQSAQFDPGTCPFSSSLVGSKQSVLRSSGQVSHTSSQASQVDVGSDLCADLVVPNSYDCHLAVPSVKRVGVVSKRFPYEIVDKKAQAILAFALEPGRAEQIGGSGEDLPMERLTVTLPGSSLPLASCEFSLPALGAAGPQCLILDSVGVAYSRLSEELGGAGGGGAAGRGQFVLRSAADQMVQLRVESGGRGQLQFTTGEGVVAATVKENIDNKANDFYWVCVHPGVNVGLIVLALLALDRWPHLPK